MFDYVRVEMKCPHCEKVFKSDEFQSKDADCCLGLIKQKYVNNFYGNCPECKGHIDVNKSEDSSDDRYIY